MEAEQRQQQLTASSDSTSTTSEHTPVSSNSESSLNSLAHPAAAAAAPPASSSLVVVTAPASSSQQVEVVAQTMEKMSIDDSSRLSQSLRPRHPNSENTSMPSSSAQSSIFSPVSSSSSSAVSASADPVSSSAGSSSSNKKKAISYAAERVIGNGSFGVVYQATVIDTGETVAIKKVLQDRRFKNRELEIMSSLNHPNVVALKHCFYSKGEKAEEVYLNLVMEYIPETIHRTLRNHTKANKLVPVLYTKVYMYQIARALAYIHAQGICHVSSRTAHSVARCRCLSPQLSTHTPLSLCVAVLSSATSSLRTCC